VRSGALLAAAGCSRGILSCGARSEARFVSGRELLGGMYVKGVAIWNKSNTSVSLFPLQRGEAA
jgi:hypothetical protein